MIESATCKIAFIVISKTKELSLQFVGEADPGKTD